MDEHNLAKRRAHLNEEIDRLLTLAADAPDGEALALLQQAEDLAAEDGYYQSLAAVLRYSGDDGWISGSCSTEEVQR